MEVVKPMMKIGTKLYDHLPTFIFMIFLAIFLLGIITGTVKADLNGTQLIEEPINTTLDPFMSFFETVTGNGMNFWLIPLIGITVGLYANSDDILISCMFMMGSGALLATGQIFAGMPGVPYMFIIFSAIGFTGIFTSLYLDHKR